MPPKIYLSTGGEGGIRTLEHLLGCYSLSRRAPSTTRPPLQNRSRDFVEPSNTFWDVTHFPGERLRPLGHLSTRPQGYRRRPTRSNRPRAQPRLPSPGRVALGCRPEGAPGGRAATPSRSPPYWEVPACSAAE